MDKQFACLENRESFMSVTAGRNIIHSKLLMKTQWYILISISKWSVDVFEAPRQAITIKYYIIYLKLKYIYICRCSIMYIDEDLCFRILRMIYLSKQKKNFITCSVWSLSYLIFDLLICCLSGICSSDLAASINSCESEQMSYDPANTFRLKDRTF